MPKLSFEDVSPLLVSAYHRGELVPFIGAGMSMPMLKGWPDFVDSLEKSAAELLGGSQEHRGKPNDPQCPSAPQELYGKAQRAATVLRNHRSQTDFYRDVANALGKNCDAVPEQTTALARIPWPLTISTNYDDLYYGECLEPVAAGHQGQVAPDKSSGEFHIEVLGRSELDCKRIVSSLSSPFDRQLIWHVQGFLGGQHPNNPTREIDEERLASLQSELVIGHAEYRRVANTAPVFHRCFGEVFRSRSFLFLGSNLREDYFLNMFSEVLELCGPSPVPHFAFVVEDAIDAEFLADQMNIFVCKLTKDCVIKNLGELKRNIENTPHPPSWSFSFDTSASCAPDFEIVNGNPPTTRSEGEAVAVGCGRRDNKPELEAVQPCGILPTSCEANVELTFESNEYVLRIGESPCYLLSSKLSTNLKNPGNVYNAVGQLLERVANDGFSLLHFVLPSSAEHPLSHVYAFSPVYTFIKAVHAFGDWRAIRRKEKNQLLKLKLYTVQSEVLLNLSWRRIDVEELLISPRVRFLALLCPGPKIEPLRRVLYYPATEHFKNVFDDLGIPHKDDTDDWVASIYPSPRRRGDEPGAPLEQSTASLAQMTIQNAGIVYGSVLTIRRREPIAFRRQIPSTVQMRVKQVAAR